MCGLECIGENAEMVASAARLIRVPNAQREIDQLRNSVAAL